MPSLNIERAIKKGLEKSASLLEEVVYEAYGPGGFAIVVFGLTDNKNRASAEIRHILSKHGASLAAQGSALWAFQKQEDGWTPRTTLEPKEQDRDELKMLMEELEESDDVQEVCTNAEL